MLYHLSKTANLTKLTPQVPECAVDIVDIHEDCTTERICFSDSIEGCLSALQDIPNKYYVYTPNQWIDESAIHYPSFDEVMDGEINHEVWVTEEISVKCIGVIQTENWDWVKYYTYGTETVSFFHYPYKWVENSL